MATTENGLSELLDDCHCRGIRRRRFCTPPIGIVTAPPTRTWRTW